jgi:SAM-dependent methyltransferase
VRLGRPDVVQKGRLGRSGPPLVPEGTTIPEHDYDAGAYGRDIADDYDELYRALPDTDAAVERLAALAGRGPILELGIGTGRLALPLVARGYEVSGIDGSQEMLDVLRTKPGGDAIPLVVGDFAEAELPQRFALVVLALHTIFGLPTPDDQIRCFRNAARRARDGGRFVVEARVLDPADFADGQAVQSRFSGPESVELQIQRYDAVTQRMQVTNVHLADGRGVRLNSYVNQYASPRELDLMARIGGLRLRERWEDWEGRTFSAASRRHISVYERPTRDA